MIPGYKIFIKMNFLLFLGVDPQIQDKVSTFRTVFYYYI